MPVGLCDWFSSLVTTMETDKTTQLASISDADLSEQTAAQYRAVIHMAEKLRTVHEQTLYAMPSQSRGVLELQCVRSAEIMEMLGDLLNEMSAVDESEDSWMEPIFEKAHEVFPENEKPLA